MTRIEIKSRVGPDGVLNLTVPVGPEEANREVVVTVESARSATTDDSPEEWARFIELTAGSWAGEPLIRPDQGEIENRRNWE